ncbi:hypothetical protein [Aeromicrobium sp. UC242_57]|uniref:hypothetical protein n=1 Tax=Aeromicrobium sp. UC242_57 TaxID=3374624 RepID=UPI00378AD7F3
MSAERLREAARVLREGAEGAIESLHGSRDWHGIGTGYRTPIEGHIQNMSPTVALAVADLLEEVGAWREEGLGLIPEGNLGDAWLEVEKRGKQTADIILGPPA